MPAALQSLLQLRARLSGKRDTDCRTRTGGSRARPSKQASFSASQRHVDALHLLPVGTVLLHHVGREDAHEPYNNERHPELRQSRERSARGSLSPAYPAREKVESYETGAACLAQDAVRRAASAAQTRCGVEPTGDSYRRRSLLVQEHLLVAAAAASRG
jgi:hypothetical protein